MSSLNKNINTVKCSTEGCNNKAHHKGLCRKHNVQPHMLKTCATEGCNKLVGTTGCKGHCRTHYMKPSALKTCATEGCNKLVGRTGGKGHCGAHYASPATLKSCAIQGCSNKARTKGLCRTHYVNPAMLEMCGVEGCDKMTYRKGLCIAHYKRVFSKGTPEPPELNKQTTHGYIIHDKTGTPIYVGITCNFESRMYNHETCQPWGSYVNIPEQPSVTFDNREQASEWERQTIAKLVQTTPLFNDMHNPNWSLDYEHDLLERTIDIHNQHTMLKSVVESHT